MLGVDRAALLRAGFSKIIATPASSPNETR